MKMIYIASNKSRIPIYRQHWYSLNSVFLKIFQNEFPCRVFVHRPIAYALKTALQMFKTPRTSLHTYTISKEELDEKLSMNQRRVDRVLVNIALSVQTRACTILWSTNCFFWERPI